MVPLAVVMIADRRDDATARCAAILGAMPGATVEWLPDEARYVQTALRSAKVGCLVLCGGDSLSLPAGLREGLAAEITRTFPGFGEAVRRDLADHPVLSALADVRGMAAGQTAVFAVPASPTLCQHAVAHIQRLRMPLQALLRGQEVHLDAEPEPISEPGAAPSRTPEVPAVVASTLPAEEEEALPPGSGGGGIAVLPSGPEDEPPPREEGEERLRWEAALLALDARPERERWYQMPDSILDIAPAQEVLERAGGRASAVLADGRLAGVFGFPDLLRPSSKALLIIEARGVLEVVALHRHPARVGIVGRGSLLRLADAEAESEARTGAPTPYGGTLCAVEQDAVYLEREGRVYAWDGRREHDMGTEGQATASLLLRWSER